ncbi:helix-turn-helix transcriptional regulator [Streptomyces sp. H27-D2]|uniref:helix-turn-helix transcriptional regulator n=1 Tax=Streptomyces sp. H27-D2 TaxID=3046304 RepID=UPI002DBACA9A|nr:AAA family ATPase [Streptomyces sp. H27-D2]MEC4019816.1 AAA family ATPase [Streptomyces sp. H27-D2]
MPGPVGGELVVLGPAPRQPRRSRRWTFRRADGAPAIPCPGRVPESRPRAQRGASRAPPAPCPSAAGRSRVRPADLIPTSPNNWRRCRKKRHDTGDVISKAQAEGTGVSVKLSERNKELQLLNRLYAGCVRGKGAVVLANGPVGCGKTALVQGFAERVMEQGGLFLSVTAAASERLHPFGLIDQLMTAMRAAGVDAAPLAAEDAGVTASAGDPQGAPRVPLGLLQRISRTVCEFAGGPLVISVDDVHFADEPSLQCLRYLIRRIDSSAVVIVLTESSCHERELATLHAETLHLPYCHRIGLAPLSGTGVGEQLTERLGDDPAVKDPDPWARTSGGNPLLLRALIEDYLRQDSATSGEPVPGESFRHAVLRCLHRCEPSMLDAARASAVLGESASPSLVSDFLGGDARSVRRSLTDLNAAGLLAADRFRHDRAQLAVLTDIPAGDLCALHGRAAELLHESGASAVAVAEQIMAAHDCVKAEWRVGILREAARDATDSGDIATSVEYLRHASGLCADAAQEAQVTAELAEAQWLIDPAKATRHLHQLSHAVRAGVLTGDGAMVPVKQLIWRGEFTQADSLLRAMETGAGRDPGDTARRTEPSGIATARLWLSLCYPGLAREARAGGAAEETADEIGDALSHPSIVSGPVSALIFLNLSASLSGDGEDLQGADQVLHGFHAGSTLAARLFALIHLIQTSRLDEAVLWSERLLQEPWIRRLPMPRAVLETIRSVASLRRDDAVTAGEAARTALEIVTPSAWGVMVGLPLALAVRAATELGEFDAAMSYLCLPVPPIMFETPFALPYLRALGRYHLAVGRPHTALADFQSCGDLMVKWRLDRSELADWRNDAAEAFLAMGYVGQARRLIEDRLSRLGDGRSRARGTALLREAVRILAACDDQLELKCARSDLAEALDGPGTPLDRPMPTLARKIPSPGRHAPESLDIGDGPVAEESESNRVLAELTDAELRVGALAAAGCTNRRIAGELFITVSTVEQHLTKIYRKLKVSSRSGLPAELRAFTDIPCLPNG